MEVPDGVLTELKCPGTSGLAAPGDISMDLLLWAGEAGSASDLAGDIALVLELLSS